MCRCLAFCHCFVFVCIVLLKHYSTSLTLKWTLSLLLKCQLQEVGHENINSVFVLPSDFPRSSSYKQCICITKWFSYQVKLGSTSWMSKSEKSHGDLAIGDFMLVCKMETSCLLTRTSFWGVTSSQRYTFTHFECDPIELALKLVMICLLLGLGKNDLLT